MSRRTLKQGAGKQWGEGKDFRLADEVVYIQNKAAEHDGRVVHLGQLVLFSTDTGDAWLLDVTDQLAAPLLETAILNRFVWRSLTPASPSGGRGTITSKGLPSFTPIVIRAGSGPSSAILRRPLRERVSSEISNMFG